MHSHHQPKITQLIDKIGNKEFIYTVERVSSPSHQGNSLEYINYADLYLEAIEKESINENALMTIFNQAIQAGKWIAIGDVWYHSKKSLELLYDSPKELIQLHCHWLSPTCSDLNDEYNQLLIELIIKQTNGLESKQKIALFSELSAAIQDVCQSCELKKSSTQADALENLREAIEKQLYQIKKADLNQPFMQAHQFAIWNRNASDDDHARVNADVALYQQPHFP